ncbi:MAG TPA: hypothetical protein VFJ71_01295 [Candidatus Limnocylindrales bacterium]|nr:hypothetical protein [Candidatus Limnocylindrales bacterium]
METNDLGVVNPLRVPRPVRAIVQRLLELPTVGRVFVILAIADLTLAFVAHGIEISALTSALTLLLPVAIVWRSSDVNTADRRVLLGGVLIASAELATVLFRALDPYLLSTATIEDDIAAMDVPLAVRGLLVMIATTIGWALVARGLGELRPRMNGQPRILGRILAAVAIAIGVGLAAVDLLAIASNLSGATLSLRPTQVVLELAYVATWAVTAWVVWVTVSRAGSTPVLATSAAAVAAGLWAVGAIPAIAVSFAVLVMRGDGPIDAQNAAIWIYVLAAVGTAALFVVAFGAGLADSHGVPDEGPNTVPPDAVETRTGA